jgi:S1-C subfamily serine protease
VALRSKTLEGLSLGNDWSSGQLVVVAVGAGTEADAAGLLAGDKVVKVNDQKEYALMDNHLALGKIKAGPRPAVFLVERVENLGHTEELHRVVRVYYPSTSC